MEQPWFRSLLRFGQGAGIPGRNESLPHPLCAVVADSLRVRGPARPRLAVARGRPKDATVTRRIQSVRHTGGDLPTSAALCGDLSARRFRAVRDGLVLAGLVPRGGGADQVSRPQHFLYFLPLPQGQGSLRRIWRLARLGKPGVPAISRRFARSFLARAPVRRSGPTKTSAMG